MIWKVAELICLAHKLVDRRFLLTWRKLIEKEEGATALIAALYFNSTSQNYFIVSTDR